MADQRQSSCASPVCKRPREENDGHLDGLNMQNEETIRQEAFKRHKPLSEPPGEVTSSSDPNTDMCNGDSGFHELTSANSLDQYSADPLQYSHIANGHSDGVSQEADSSEPHFRRELSGANSHERIDFDNEMQEDNDADEVASTISNLSGLSDLSELSGQEWKPSGPLGWVHKQMSLGTDPVHILQRLLPQGAIISPHLDTVTLWKIILNILSEEEPPRRTKLSHINTFNNVIELLKTCKKILVLTGAGVSVSCGIPDFRSKNGVYARLSKDFPSLPDPQAMFDIHFFRKDPRPFFKFAREIYPGQFSPSSSHRFIKLLEDKGKLLRNYTQNIDTLEQICGLKKVITCHGSFATASCTRCSYKVDSSAIKDDIFNQTIPYCPFCPKDSEDMAVMKPDIVFFGEGLSAEFHHAMAKDKNDCDLLIVMGSSLKVRPVALIPSSIPPDVPQILINREPLKHVTFDVELLGDCDIIIKELCNRLGWDSFGADQPSLAELTELPPQSRSSPEPEGQSPSSTAVAESSEVNNNSDLERPDSSSWKDSLKKNVSLQPDASSLDTDNPDSTSEEKDAEPHSSNGFKNHREYWKSKAKESITSRLPEGCYLHVSPSTYIFKGAEVYMDSLDDADSIHAGCDTSENSESESTASSSSSDEDDDFDLVNCTKAGSSSSTLENSLISNSTTDCDETNKRPTEIDTNGDIEVNLDSQDSGFIPSKTVQNVNDAPSSL